MKIDVVVPTKTCPNSKLYNTLSSSKKVSRICIVKDKPLSIARKNGLVYVSTEWVAMFDDDVTIPANWFDLVTKHIAKNVGAVATVATQANTHSAAYDKVTNTLIRLEKIDTSPHINNVLVRRELFQNYNPPPLFFGEDHYFKQHVENMGYDWIVISNIGVVHHGKITGSQSLGKSYRHHYTPQQFARRMAARSVLTPFASAESNNLLTFFVLTKQNVEFTTGWIRGDL